MLQKRLQNDENIGEASGILTAIDRAFAGKRLQKGKKIDAASGILTRVRKANAYDAYALPIHFLKTKKSAEREAFGLYRRKQRKRAGSHFISAQRGAWSSKK